MNRIPNPELVQEMLHWATKADKQAKIDKAHRVMIKCIRRGKIKMAKKIERKYGKHFRYDDTVTAFGFALLNSK